MRTYLFVLASVGVLSACVKPTEGDPSSEGVVDIAAIQTLATYNVPVQATKTSIVTIGTDTVAVTQSPMTINVSSAALRANEVRVTYTDEAIYQNFASNQYWQYLSFEDTRKGDYDYNDLVIHARVHSARSSMANGVILYKHTVSVQPVALGSSRVIGLGILYKDDLESGTLQEKMLTDNCRATLFNGNPVFPINTDPEKEIKKVSGKLAVVFGTVNPQAKFDLVWFIESGGERLYAATTNFGANSTLDMVSPDGLPYGISLTKKWDYPKEKSHIRDAYPGFDRWIRSGDETQLLAGKVSSYTFPASPAKSAGYDLWDWEY